MKKKGRKGQMKGKRLIFSFIFSTKPEWDFTKGSLQSNRRNHGTRCTEYLFINFFWLPPQHVKFLSQGSNQCHSSEAGHCRDKTGSLICSATRFPDLLSVYSALNGLGICFVGSHLNLNGTIPCQSTDQHPGFTDEKI